MTEDEDHLLSELQRDAMTLFFSLGASAGFVLTGASAMVLQNLTHRRTADVDLATVPGGGSIRDAEVMR